MDPREGMKFDCRVPGYEGEYCQFVAGGMPSDWTLDNYMHPQLQSAYYNGNGTSNGGGVTPLAGILIGAAVALILIAVGILGWVVNRNGSSIRDALRRNEMESDSGRSSAAASSSNGNAGEGSFAGGKSVYKSKKDSRFVATPDSLDADGAVLQEAMEDVDLDHNVSMEEVDLDADKPGEMA